MHPLLQLLVSQPALLGEHAQGYLALLGSEVADLTRTTRQRLIWAVAAALCGTVTLMLGGVALMLWVALPGMTTNAAWVLALTPCVPLLATLGCCLSLRFGADTPAFANIKEQLQVDLQLLKEVSPP